MHVGRTRLVRELGRRIRTILLIEAVAADVALGIIDFAALGRKGIATPAVTPAAQGQHGLLVADADGLAVARGLVGVGALIGQAGGGGVAALVGHGAQGDRGARLQGSGGRVGSRGLVVEVGMCVGAGGGGGEEGEEGEGVGGRRGGEC